MLNFCTLTLKFSAVAYFQRYYFSINFYVYSSYTTEISCTHFSNPQINRSGQEFSSFSPLFASSVFFLYILQSPACVFSSQRMRCMIQEALHGDEVTRAGLGRAEYSESNQLLHSCDKVRKTMHHPCILSRMGVAKSVETLPHFARRYAS